MDSGVTKSLRVVRTRLVALEFPIFLITVVLGSRLFTSLF